MDQQLGFAQKYIYVFVHMCVYTCLHVTIVIMKSSGSQPSEDSGTLNSFAHVVGTNLCYKIILIATS